MSTLRTERLTKSYAGRTVVRDVDLSVSSGEVVGLLGPNGAGKTTTFGMVVGLTGPDSGRVLLAMIELSEGRHAEAAPVLERARVAVKDWESAPFQLGSGVSLWFDWGNARILLREAEAMMPQSGQPNASKTPDAESAR